MDKEQEIKKYLLPYQAILKLNNMNGKGIVDNAQMIGDQTIYLSRDEYNLLPNKNPWIYYVIDNEFIFKGDKLIYPAYKGNPVLHYDFLDMKNDYVTKGIAQDLSSNRNHGTLQNFAYEEDSGYKGKGLEFDGVDDVIQSTLSLTYKTSFEVTLKAPVTIERTIFVHRPSGMAIVLHLNNIYTIVNESARGAALNNWRVEGVNTIYVNYIDNIPFVYINGIETIYTNSITITNVTDDNLLLGGRQGNYRMFDGSIYSFRIHSRALTPSEILHNYNIDKERFKYPDSEPIVNAINRRAALEGFELPPENVKVAILDMIQSLADKGLWSKFDLFLNFAFNKLGLQGYRRINWVNPNGDLADLYGGLIDDMYGFEGNGVDAYIDTNFNPAIGDNKYQLNDAHRIAVLFSQPLGTSTGVNTIDGASVSASNNNSFNSVSNGIRINQGSGSQDIAVPFRGLGFSIINRDSSNTCQFVKQDILTNTTSSSTQVLNANQEIFRRQLSTYGEVGISHYSIGSAFTYQQSQDFRIIYNKFLTDIGLEPIA